MPMMMKTCALAAPLAALLLFAATPQAEASNYPPDYDFCGPSDTVYTGPFELIRDTVDVDHAKLTVAYDGYLRDDYPDDEINIYLWLNGHDAFLQASPGTYDDAYIFLNSGPRGCVWCSPGGVNQASVCDGLQYPPYSSGTWACADPSSVEAHIFHWAFGSGGVQNAWDIYVAAESHGHWDSNYGNNFYGRFEPRVSCY
jgi:hypothetical protein